MSSKLTIHPSSFSLRSQSTANDFTIWANSIVSQYGLSPAIEFLERLIQEEFPGFLPVFKAFLSGFVTDCVLPESACIHRDQKYFEVLVIALFVVRVTQANSPVAMEVGRSLDGILELLGSRPVVGSLNS